MTVCIHVRSILSSLFNAINLFSLFLLVAGSYFLSKYTGNTGDPRVADPHHCNVDPDTCFFFNVDPDTSFFFNADPYPTTYFNADPAPLQSDANLQTLVFRPYSGSTISLRASTVSVHSPPRHHFEPLKLLK